MAARIRAPSLPKVGRIDPVRFQELRGSIVGQGIVEVENDGDDVLRSGHGWVSRAERVESVTLFQNRTTRKPLLATNLFPDRQTPPTKSSSPPRTALPFFPALPALHRGAL